MFLAIPHRLSRKAGHDLRAKISQFLFIFVLYIFNRPTYETQLIQRH